MSDIWPFIWLQNTLEYKGVDAELSDCYVL